jgi:hypothetical protein
MHKLKFSINLAGAESQYSYVTRIWGVFTKMRLVMHFTTYYLLLLCSAKTSCDQFFVFAIRRKRYYRQQVHSFLRWTAAIYWTLIGNFGHCIEKTYQIRPEMFSDGRFYVSAIMNQLKLPITRRRGIVPYTVLWSVVAKYRKWPFSASHRTKTP